MGGSASSSGTPAAKKDTPTPTPTPAVSLTTYQSTHFSVGYPAAWKSVNQNNITKVPGFEQVEFDGQTASMVVQGVPDRANASTDKYLSLIVTSLRAATLKDDHKDNVPASVMVANESWEQESYTGVNTTNGATIPAKLVCVADHHTSNNYMFSICIAGATGKQGNEPQIDDIFQAVIKSFQFK